METCHRIAQAAVLAVAVLLAMLLPPAARAAEMTEFGPSGGFGGSSFAMCPFTLEGGEAPRITELRVSSAEYVNSIEIILSNGLILRRGGSGGKLKVMKLDPDENITYIGGRYGDYVDHLIVSTSKRRKMEWGGDGGKARFDYAALPGTRIGGFVGRSADYIDAIGVCLLAS